MIRSKVIANAAWIITCKIIQAILALVINMLTARYLGPAQFGTINYASSLVSFVVPIMQLGINSILVQELVNHPEKDGEILGTSITMNVVSAFLCLLGIFAFVSIANAGEKETILVCLLYSITLVFQALEMVQYWFQAKLLSKYTSITMLFAYLVVSGYRIFLLISNKNIYWFAIANTLDCLLIAIMLICLYYRLGGNRFVFSINMAKKLLFKGRYFIISSLMITIFSQTDRVMLKLMIDESATGYYSAAVACALLSNFIFAAILDSARPTLFESRKRNHQEFEKSVVLLFSIINFLSFAQCIVMTLFADLIVKLLYGSMYEPSIVILRLVVWYTTFSYAGTVRSIWILAEGQQKYLWVINLSGAIINVILNFIFIPIMGAQGAALTSLVTQCLTNIVVVQLIKPLRRSNYLLLLSFNPMFLIKSIKELFKSEQSKIIER
jgi:O-antigen/teichoic acid export membrane protein